MGNLVASCTTGMVKRSRPKCVARVLLVDGSALKCRAPMAASKLLADYPNHVICALASLKPGLHALSSLLPEEKLEMGGLYLLLPLKSHPHKAPASRRGHQGTPIQPAQKKVGAHERREAPTEKCDVGRWIGGPGRREGDMGMGKSGSAGELSSDGEVGLPQRGERQALRRSRTPAMVGDGGRLQEGEAHVGNGRAEPAGTGRPVRPTHRSGSSSGSGSVRRSSSWTPRLQPIHERR